MKPTLVVLAAGMGSRYGGLKQLDEVGPSGETIIDYSVYDAVRGGFGKVVFVIRESFFEEFKEKVSNKYQGKIEVVHVFQDIEPVLDGFEKVITRKKPWGTGHAVLVAKDVVNEPFAVINADDYYGQDGFRLIADFLIHQASPKHYAMVGYILQNTLSDFGHVSRGICHSDKQHKLIDVVERTKVFRTKEGDIQYEENEERFPLEPNDIVSMNFWGFHQNVFDHIEEQFAEFVRKNKDNPSAEFFIPLYVNKMIVDKTIDMTVLESKDKWFGITYKEDKPVVMDSFRKLSNERRYISPLW